MYVQFQTHPWGAVSRIGASCGFSSRANGQDSLHRPALGPAGPVGQNQLRSWQYIADLANQKNWAGGPKFEIVGYDNKLSPQESLTILKQVQDQGIRYIVQGNGSSVALASRMRCPSTMRAIPAKKSFI